MKKINNSTFNKQLYKEAQKEYNQAEKLARRTHNDKLQTDLSNGNLTSKKWWKTVNNLSGKPTRSSIPVLKKNDQLYSTSQQKAEILASTFANKFRVDGAEDPSPELNKTTSTSMSNFVFKPKTIRQILKNLKIEKATGPDQIPNRVLKTCHAELASPLCRLFKMCFHYAVFPSQWKNASVVPLHKRNSKADPSMYRPIYLLSNISKVMVAVIAKSMQKFFSSP